MKYKIILCFAACSLTSFAVDEIDEVIIDRMEREVDYVDSKDESKDVVSDHDLLRIPEHFQRTQNEALISMNN